MTADKKTLPSPENSQSCSVVIFHEQDEDLIRATYLCDQLMSRYWANLDIRIKQWPFAALNSDPAARDAGGEAVAADLLVVAASNEGEFDEGFLTWIEHWLPQREQREGALVALLGSISESEGRQSYRHVRLHKLALKAGLDYLNHLPETPKDRLTNFDTWSASRAQTVTDTLKDILNMPPGSRME